jgi:pantoate--beta-alanine ligase
VMRVWSSVPEWRDRRRALNGSRLGFVPTMGALHRGHASLVERCRQENEIVVVSIFVNPSQFNDPKDLERYPRPLDRDLALLRDLGVDEVFTPTAPELYPDGYRFQVVAESFTNLMEGTHRPGYLQGVMTVVLKLLNIVQADRAYFGEKDYQQFRVLDAMVKDFFIPTALVACPTVRQSSGLAESSRNALLPPGARDQAAWLYRALSTASNTSEAKQILESHGFAVEYLEEHWGRRFVAAMLDGVRLIDNVKIEDIVDAPLP